MLVSVSVAVFLLCLRSDVYPEEMHSFEKMLTMDKKEEFDVRSRPRRKYSPAESSRLPQIIVYPRLNEKMGGEES